MDESVDITNVRLCALKEVWYGMGVIGEMSRLWWYGTNWSSDDDDDIHIYKWKSEKKDKQPMEI
jgi:hypothetical protein